MLESFLIFIAIIIGIYVLLAIVSFILQEAEMIKFFAKVIAGAVVIVWLFITGWYLLVEKGGFLGAVGIIIMIPGAWVGICLPAIAIGVIIKWWRGSKAI